MPTPPGSYLVISRQHAEQTRGGSSCDDMFQSFSWERLCQPWQMAGVHCYLGSLHGMT